MPGPKNTEFSVFGLISEAGFFQCFGEKWPVDSPLITYRKWHYSRPKPFYTNHFGAGVLADGVVLDVR